MNFKQIKYVFLFVLALFFASFAQAQLTANADGVTLTEYSSGSQDNIYLFCSAPNEAIGELTATFQGGGNATFEWLKYNENTGTFESFRNDNSGSPTSTIGNLADGGYRVNATLGGVTQTYTAWVMNSWYSATAEITESTCDYFQLQASFEGANLVYYDLTNGAQKEVFKDVKTKWEADGGTVSSVLSPSIYNPPPRDTDYKLTVYDRFGCNVEVNVSYQSIVTLASFTATPMTGEAPLEVTFSNTSENADQYQWFFFRDLDEIKYEAQQNGTVSDSIMETAIDQSPVFIYENSGTYDVKLVTIKNSDSGICTDTIYLDGYIVADTSFVDVPNVFTPNGDGANDEFVVKYHSLKEINIKIFNRWGKEIFAWDKNNIQGFDDSVSESVWDGRIGGRYASPGVYYYVIEALGRDDKKRFAHGFVHLFREK